MEASGVRPALEAGWPELASMLAEHDADPVSGGLSYLEMAAIARFLADKFRRSQTDSFREFFIAVERCLLEGDEEAVNLVTAGLLEDLQNSNVTDIEDYSVWTPYQGPTTLRAWSAVEAFWNGDVNAISSFESRPGFDWALGPPRPGSNGST